MGYENNVVILNDRAEFLGNGIVIRSLARAGLVVATATHVAFGREFKDRDAKEYVAILDRIFKERKRQKVTVIFSDGTGLKMEFGSLSARDVSYSNRDQEREIPVPGLYVHTQRIDIGTKANLTGLHNFGEEDFKQFDIPVDIVVAGGFDKRHVVRPVAEEAKINKGVSGAGLIIDNRCAGIVVVSAPPLVYCEPVL